ncbi:MAG: PhnD/SsuA/transferrin family substrate-binding protein [Acidimicrobiales bacterium]|nr:PhnD/SsuA/transferrin family substrate-binding protein [Acidimicrobiales bacterium]
MRAVSCLSPGLPASLFEAFARVLGADVWFQEHASGPEVGDDPFADGRADIGWICSTSFADQSWAAGPGVRLLGVAWVPDDPDADGRPVYFGDLVVPAGSPIRGVADLAGRRVGCNDPVSLSGHHALRFAADDAGFDLDRADLVFTGGHQRSMDALVAGTIDAAVVDSVSRNRRARVDPAVASFDRVARFGPWPVQPLVVRADLDDHLVDDLRRRLLGARDDPGVRAALTDAGLLDLVAVDGSIYDLVGARLAAT